MTRPGAGPAVALAGVLVAGAAVVTAAGKAHGVALHDSGGIAIRTPADGASVPATFALAWEPGHHHGRFAVVVDNPAPRPGALVEPGPTTLITSTPQLLLALPDREGGSPSARSWHRIAVVALDGDSRRVGEAVASVSVRVSVRARVPRA